MNPELQLLISTWDTLKNYIAKKDRVEAAEHIVRVFDEECDIAGVEDEANTFDSALKAAVIGHYGIGEEEAEMDDWD
jgi:hypothetical protein